MYNRYIRNEQGTYTRIPEEDSPSGSTTAEAPPPSGSPPHSNGSSASVQGPDLIRDSLQKLLDRLHLEHIDTGDLLLLLMIFLLFKEDADEELLIALGLLLIL